MAVSRVNDTDLEGNRVTKKFKFNPAIRTLTGAVTLTADDSTMQSMNANGSARVITLPSLATSEGLMFVIFNTSPTAVALTVNDAAAALVASVAQGKCGIFFCDGVVWRCCLGS